MKKTFILAALVLATLSSPAFSQDKSMDMMKKWYEGVYTKQDTSNDGFISKDEYMAMAGAEYTKMDTNKDGKVSKEEFMAGTIANYNKMMNSGN